MSSYKIVIPSHNRAENLLKTTYEKIIIPNKLNFNNIYIFVSGVEQKNIYKKIIPSNYYNKIVISPKGYTNTINYITKYFKEKEKLVMIHDDVRKFVKLKNGKLVRYNKLHKVLITGFKLLQDLKLNLGGFYPVPNVMFMKNRKEITTNLSFIFEPIRFWINRKDIKITAQLKQDVQLSLLFYKRDVGVLRMNKYSFNTPYLEGEGGITGRTLKNELKESKKIIKQFPNHTRLIIKKNRVDIGLRNRDAPI